jgi:phosphoribosylformylglycinamidine cyclo-ligase
MKKSAYKDSGVDIDAGAELVERIKPHVKKTFREGVVSELGGFGAFFDLAKAGYSDPLLVSSTDGVGTKIKIAIDTGIHDTIGIDLVAMCVNDIVVQGAEPLFFLDYFACGKLDTGIAERVIAGIAEGCRQAGCALVGGETAEMPGMYAEGDYDLAGFTVGAVSRDDVITGENVCEGDAIIGIASSGLHSNGYSLVRKLIKDGGFSYDDKAPFDENITIGHSVIVPTRIYVRPLLETVRKCEVKALAHITGGGLSENIPRVIPADFSAILDANAWNLPPLFRWLAELGELEPADMSRTFNCGIGMVLVCPQEEKQNCMDVLRKACETVFEIGRIEKRSGEAVKIENLEQAWRIKN